MESSTKETLRSELCLPLWSRAIATAKFPSLLPDYDARRILNELGQIKKPSIFLHLQYACLDEAVVQYDLSQEVKQYLSNHPQATIVVIKAGLSCLRKQMNINNPWVNLDSDDVISIREKHIPKGENEKNIAWDLSDFAWFDLLPFDLDKGIIFLADGIFQENQIELIKSLVSAMSDFFPGGEIVFNTDSDMRYTEEEMKKWNEKIQTIESKACYLDYDLPSGKCSPLTKLYVKMQSKKHFLMKISFDNQPNNLF